MRLGAARAYGHATALDEAKAVFTAEYGLEEAVPADLFRNLPMC
jgi:hypothetical protein